MWQVPSHPSLWERQSTWHIWARGPMLLRALLLPLTLGFLLIDSCSSLDAKMPQTIYTGHYDAVCSCWYCWAGNVHRPINTRLVNLTLSHCLDVPLPALPAPHPSSWSQKQDDCSGGIRMTNLVYCHLPDVMITHRAAQQIFRDDVPARCSWGGLNWMTFKGPFQPKLFYIHGQPWQLLHPLLSLCPFLNPPFQGICWSLSLPESHPK